MPPIFTTLDQNRHPGDARGEMIKHKRQENKTKAQHVSEFLYSDLVYVLMD